MGNGRIIICNPPSFILSVREYNAFLVSFGFLNVAYFDIRVDSAGPNGAAYSSDISVTETMAFVLAASAQRLQDRGNSLRRLEN